MTQWFSALATLPEEPSLGPSTHVWWLKTVFNSSSRGSNALLRSPEAPIYLLHITHRYRLKNLKKHIFEIMSRLIFLLFLFPLILFVGV